MEGYVIGWQAAMRFLQQGKSWSGFERNCAFLNAPGSRFADISAASGLDFADDGRGLAVVDWDGDGDLDIWLANRTGPRLRLMLNRGESGNTSVALRLRGTVSNRDGIGARVEVVLSDPAQGRLVRTVYAGDGFLSQSSKWLHFGLGSQPAIERVAVHWPSGKRELFSGVEPGNRYLLVQGQEEAQLAPARPPIELVSNPQPMPELDPTERVVLPLRVPMPRLPYTTFDESKRQTVAADRGPLLLNLWASWCLPCIGELEELTAHANELRSAGLEVLALSIDGLDEDQTIQPADAKERLEEMRFPFDSGLATVELLDKIELIQGIVSDRTLPLAVPVSFLLDPGGSLAASYRGRLDVNVLLRDVARLEIPPGERMQLAAAPVGGRWLARLPLSNPARMAKRFADRYPEDAERFLGLALENGVVARRSERATAEERLVLDQREASILVDLAEAVDKQGRREESIAHLQRAVEIDADLARAHGSLAGLIRTTDPDEAMRHYRRAIEIDPQDAFARYGLGVTLRTAGRIDEALRHLRDANRLRPDWPEPLIPMAWILITHPEPAKRRADEAVRLAEQAVELSGDRHPVALDALAATYAAAGRAADAAATAREAVAEARARGNENLAADIELRLEGGLPRS